VRSRLLAVLGGLALMVAVLAGGQLVSAGPAAAEPAHCSGSLDHPDSYGLGHIGFLTSGDGTLIRDHPYEDCNLREQVYGSGINVHCGYVNSPYNSLWIYVEDQNTGVAGWVRWDNLHYSLPYYITINGEPWPIYYVSGTRCSGTGWWEVYKDAHGNLHQDFGVA
jgi:hypothetical protein